MNRTLDGNEKNYRNQKMESTKDRKRNMLSTPITAIIVYTVSQSRVYLSFSFEAKRKRNSRNKY